MVESLHQTPFIVLSVFLGLVLLLIVIIWTMPRHRNPRLTLECDAGIRDLVPSLSGLTLSSAHPGNSVNLLENGAFWLL